MTVPAHVLLWPHPIAGMDAYEHYMKDHHQDWPTSHPPRCKSFGSLYELFYNTANITNNYDAGFGSGLWRARTARRIAEPAERAASRRQSSRRKATSSCRSLMKESPNYFCFFISKSTTPRPPTI